MVIKLFIYLEKRLRSLLSILLFVVVHIQRNAMYVEITKLWKTFFLVSFACKVIVISYM